MTAIIPPIPSGEIEASSNNLDIEQIKEILQSDIQLNNVEETNMRAENLFSLTSQPSNEGAWAKIMSSIYENTNSLNQNNSENSKLSFIDAIKKEMTPDFEEAKSTNNENSYANYLKEVQKIFNHTNFTLAIGKVITGVSKSFETLSKQG